MAMLLLYNTKEIYRYDEILNLMNANDPDFENHALGLMKCGVLCKLSLDKKLEPDSELALNPDYKNKMFRIKVPVLLPKEMVEETLENEVPETVEDDRKHMIEASIVKIMKSRRVLMHSQLVAEVIKLVS